MTRPVIVNIQPRASLPRTVAQLPAPKSSGYTVGRSSPGIGASGSASGSGVQYCAAAASAAAVPSPHVPCSRHNTTDGPAAACSPASTVDASNGAASCRSSWAQQHRPHAWHWPAYRSTRGRDPSEKSSYSWTGVVSAPTAVTAGRPRTATGAPWAGAYSHDGSPSGRAGMGRGTLNTPALAPVPDSANGCPGSCSNVAPLPSAHVRNARCARNPLLA
jgi:hypothetical protein